jgi:hypothetical protein
MWTIEASRGTLRLSSKTNPEIVVSGGQRGKEGEKGQFGSQVEMTGERENPKTDIEEEKGGVMEEQSQNNSDLGQPFKKDRTSVHY